MSHFYVTLPSDSSMSSYPDNTVAQYVTKLSRAIKLDGDYEVALTELIYPRSFHNIIAEEEVYIHVTENDGNRMVSLCVINLESAYYESEADFANKFSVYITRKLRQELPQRDVQIICRFDAATRRLKLNVKCESNMLIRLSERFKEISDSQAWV